MDKITETISNQTCTQCQNCGEFTNYAGDVHYKVLLEEIEELREYIEYLQRKQQVE